MPQRDLLLPWRDALGNAALALECAGVAAAEARAQGGAAVRALRARRVRGRPAGRAVRRDAPARGLHPHAPPGAAVLLLDEPFASLDAITRAEMQQWLADALAAEPRTAILVTHDVEEALSTWPTASPCCRRAPAASWPRSTCRSPRPRDRRAAVTDPRARAPARAGPGGAAMRRVLLAGLLLAVFVGRLGVGRVARTPSTTSPSPPPARPSRRSATTGRCSGTTRG